MIGAHDLGHFVDIVLPEWIDPPVVTQRFNGIINEVSGHLFGG